LNFMWNPDFTKLKDPATWLAAAGQIFFSLSVGFGVIINYASYMRKRDDIALSGLTASMTNEFFEVCLGGLITLPAAFIFLGAAAGSFSTFGLGFNALPNVFALMPGGQAFGFVWFFMLFLAAMTSSLSMLQPVNAFFEEGLGLKRYGSAILLGVVTIIGSGFVLHYSKDLTALDNIDFWVGTFLIVILALIQSLVYGWVFGIERGMAELDQGALIRVPRFVAFVLKYVTPVFLMLILGATIYQSGPTYWENIQTDVVARRSVMLIGMAAAFLVVAITIANYRWKRDGKFDAVFNDED
jgi:NSS family neurotransmitter:Na+ symporter